MANLILQIGCWVAFGAALAAGSAAPIFLWGVLWLVSLLIAVASAPMVPIATDAADGHGRWGNLFVAAAMAIGCVAWLMTR